MNKKEIIWVVVLPVVLILLNTLLKGFYLSAPSIAGDEPFSIYIAQMDLSAIVRNLADGNNPPLYELLLHFWIKVFGISPLAVRLPSLIFSGLTALFIYKIGFKHFNKKVAVYASLIFVFSNYHIVYAHEARVYALLGLLSAMSMYYFLNFWSEKVVGKRGRIFLYLLSTSLLIYAHYFGFFILAAQSVFLIVNPSLVKQYWKPILLVVGSLVILYSLNLFILFTRLADSSANGTWMTPPSGVDALYSMLRQFSNAPVVTVLLLVVLVAALIKFFVVKKSKRQDSKAGLLIIIWFIFIFLTMFLVSFKVPMFLDRYLMPAAIAFPLLVAISADFIIGKRKLSMVIPSIICILFVVTVKPNMSNKRDLKEAVTKVKELKKPQTVVYIAPSSHDLNFAYHCNQSCFKNYNINDSKANLNACLNSDQIYAISHHNQMTKGPLETAEHIIYMDCGADFAAPNNGILEKLQSNFTLVNQFEFFQIFKVYEFERK